MLGSEYQLLASRTINKNLTKVGQEKHALHGLVGEVGELHSLYQKYIKAMSLTNITQ